MRQVILNEPWRATQTLCKIFPLTILASYWPPALQIWPLSYGISRASSASEPCMVRYWGNSDEKLRSHHNSTRYQKEGGEHSLNMALVLANAVFILCLDCITSNISCRAPHTILCFSLQKGSLHSENVADCIEICLLLIAIVGPSSSALSSRVPNNGLSKALSGDAAGIWTWHCPIKFVFSTIFVYPFWNSNPQ